MLVSIDELVTPAGFYAAFQESIRDQTSKIADYRENVTTWFEGRMQWLARQPSLNLYCQNLQSNPTGEWMCIDHIFVRKEDKHNYGAFPLIAVEHENGGLGLDGHPIMDREGEPCIEWAFWKALSIRAHLSVLVAYSTDQKEVLKVLSKMLTGWKNEYKTQPNCLVLFGLAKHQPPPQYAAYVATETMELLQLETSES